MNSTHQAAFKQTLPSGASLSSWDSRQLSAGCSQLVKLNGLQRWMALSRINIFWVEPRFGSDCAGIPAETQLLVWQDRQRRCHVAIPLCDGDVRASIRGDQQGIRVDWDDGLGLQADNTHRLLYQRPAVGGQHAQALLAAVIDQQHGEHDYRCRLSSGGRRIGFFSERKPLNVSVNGRKRLFRYDNDQLLEISAVIRGPCTIELHF